MIQPQGGVRAFLIFARFDRLTKRSTGLMYGWLRRIDISLLGDSRPEIKRVEISAKYTYVHRSCRQRVIKAKTHFRYTLRSASMICNIHSRYIHRLYYICNPDALYSLSVVAAQLMQVPRGETKVIKHQSIYILDRYYKKYSL